MINKGNLMFKLNIILLMTASILFVGCTKRKNFTEKVLEVNVSAKVKGLDPVNAGDTYASTEIARVYEGLLDYHYLERPYKLIPSLAEAMPTVSEDELTYTFKIKKGVFFHDDLCFPQGKGRELKAQDFVYSIARMADTKNNSTGWWLLDGKIVGLNEWSKKFEGKEANYDEVIEGLKALDDYTLQFKLTQKYPQFLYSLAMVYTYAVPREAVEKYGHEFLNHPVGTGPFMTGVYTQANTISYRKNPNYRDVFYPTTGSDEDKKVGLLASAGQKLPLVDRINVNIITEGSTRFLKFKNGDTDFTEIPKDDFSQVINEDKSLTPAFQKVGVNLEIIPDLDITYIAFNHDDPLFKDNVKLRQAMSLAYNNAESNTLFYNDTGVLAQTIIPPGIAGYDANYKNSYQEFNIEKAKKLLAEAGYPGGKGLPTINFETISTTTARQSAEFLKKSMVEIGININVSTNTWPQLTQKTKMRQAQMFGMAWLGDYPDAENFLQLLYGPNSSPGPNGGNFNDLEFNKKFDIAKNMQPSPQRAKLYAELAQSLSEKVPLMLGVHRTTFVLKHSWLKNYKYSTFSSGANSKYYDIDLDRKKEVLKSGLLKTLINESANVEKSTAAN